MPKNSSVQVLKRWIAMDRALGDSGLGRGLVIPLFAKQQGVSPRTVRRDLKAFQDVRRKELKRITEEIGKPVPMCVQQELDGVRYLFHRYHSRVACLFTSNQAFYDRMREKRAAARRKEDRHAADVTDGEEAGT